MHRHIQPVAPPLLLVLAACGGGDPQPEGPGERPNILVLIADDLTSVATGIWARGEALVETPGIDRVADRGGALRAGPGAFAVLHALALSIPAA
jgi:hypothetical protein